MFWKLVAKPLLFLLPAETAHYASMGAFSNLLKIPGLSSFWRFRHFVNDPRLASEVCGMHFVNPVGLAAGFDKDARWHKQLGCLGFGHIEVGTITGEGQTGNPQPRLFRLPTDKALINRMGFNNAGSAEVARLLTRELHGEPSLQPLGINIGKTKVVSEENATDDYLKSFRRLFLCADYFTINVSSPNTPGLRKLQDREQLLQLIPAITELNAELAQQHKTHRRPIFLKIAPDLTEFQLDDFQHIVEETHLNGIIATNTTISREDLTTPKSQIDSCGAGGLSGAPLTTRSRHLVNQLYRRVGDHVPIIGVGGILSGADAWQMILAGASLVQIYTGFIYGGPGTAKRINRYLLQQLEKHGLPNISAAVGAADDLDEAAGG
ncbi:MAG: quinone-dependent dihydroorotate dehydrogenase [Planctomycetota bacterium]|nr:quinone-dependent dihydroorotate dehydrogenase [Planctomycetota bacterium]